MPKTGLKAFVYSFSVSLFAIVAANRAFWHDKTSETPSIDLSNKNIVLFLKNTQPVKSPVKKIALNVLPDIQVAALPTPLPQPEIILADTSDLLEIPLEVGSISATDDLSDATQALVLADVLYSPEKPLETPKIEAEEIYAPEPEATPQFKAPEIKPTATAKIAATAKQETAKKEKPQSNDNALQLARAAEPAVIPLQKSNNTTPNSKIVKIGQPQDLNQVALNSDNIPIQSMEKKDLASPNEASTEGKTWNSMADSPWLIAKSGGGAKNQLAVKEFADKSNQEIKQALEAGRERSGIQVAAETVKNLIIPIPEEIVKDDNLTPKLAYPSSSEDATTEKMIDAKIKQQVTASSAEKQDILTPLEEDIPLDLTPLPSTTASSDKAESKQKAEAKDNKEEKKGIMSALNSIFTSSVKTVTEAKEKAIAKAQAKRSFKKRLAQTRPVSIMPTEIRLSFQPNRAEISGQTLRWVQAFATKAAEAPGMSLEIRIDGTSSMPLQQKRLNLLHNILTNKGVGYSQINTVFTTREPNSFILRTVTAENNERGNDRKRNRKSSSNYIQW